VAELRRLRVAFVVASLDIGGSEHQMLRLAELLPRDRYVVDFILLSRRGALADRAERAGSKVHVIGWGGGHSPIRSLPDFWRLVRTLRRGRYDIVDAWLFHAYAILAVARPLCRVPILISGRRSLSEWKRGFGFVERVLDVVARRNVDMIVANSFAVRDDVAAFEHLDRNRIRVIHNGVDDRGSMDPAARSALRSSWGIGPNELLVGCVANYKTGKGQETLIRAFGQALPSHPELRLILVGEGPLRAILERLVRDLDLGAAVRLHGAVPEATDIIGAFDIAAQASWAEGLPNAVLEAAAAGLPIVATDAGGTAEILDGGRTGICVPIGDEAAIAEALGHLCDDPALRASLGEAARAHVRAVFSAERFVAEMAALYDELALSKAILG
jgi:glycosyltransferase involved in cell wall biosynthesis